MDYIRQLFHWFEYVRVSQDGCDVPYNMKEYITSCVRSRKERPLKIAVIGGPGTGKTTLISALANISVEHFHLREEGGEPMEYLDSEVPNIIYCDHPGIEMDDAKNDEYYNSLISFDAFIIVTALRVKEIDVVLLKGIIKKLKKTVLFVRCKIDKDVNKLKSSSVAMSEDALIEKIQDNIRKSVEDCGSSNIPVFIVSSIFRDRWDFPKLKDELVASTMKIKQSLADDIKKDVKVLIASRRRRLEAILKKTCWVVGFACFLLVPKFLVLFLEQVIRKGVDYFRSCYWFNDFTNKIKSRRSSHNLLYSELSAEQLVMDTVKEAIPRVQFEWLHLIPFFGTLPCAINAYRTTKRIGTSLLFQFENDALSKWCQEVDNEVERN